MIRKKYNSKWKRIGISEPTLRAIYSNARIKSATILKNRHKREYKVIIKYIMKKEFIKIKNQKGGLKK